MKDDLQKEFAALVKQMTQIQQAEMMLPIYEAHYLADKAPRLAIDAARVDELTEKLLDDVRRSSRLAWGDACRSLGCSSYNDVARAEAAFVAAGIIDNVFSTPSYQQDAYLAFARTTDDLRLKVIETGKGILTRDKETGQ